MNLQELIQHARDNGLVITADQLQSGQLGMIVEWGPRPLSSYRRQAAAGTVVMRQHDNHHALIVVGSKCGDLNVGSWWPDDALPDIEVMPLTPEVPSLPAVIPTPIGADFLSVGHAGVIVEWNSGVGGQTAFERAATGALVIRERGDALIVVQRSPEDTAQIHDAGEFWRPENVPQVRIVPVQIELPYEVEA